MTDAKVCGWNGCVTPASPDFDGRCSAHEWSQCQTEGCSGDADDGDSYDGLCSTCAEALAAAEL